MSQSTIEWTDKTWNPVTGCTKISTGCRNCYAERMAKRQWAMAWARVQKAVAADKTLAPNTAMAREKYRNGFKVTCHPDVLDQPLHWKKPRNIFVCSMSDLFHEDVPTRHIVNVFYTMHKCPQHTFQVLTKRPERMRVFTTETASSVVLPNVHLGTSCENQEIADERIPYLLQTPAAVRFLSMEPLLGPVDLTNRCLSINPDDSDRCTMKTGHRGNHHALRPTKGWGKDEPTFLEGINWVIVGGESGPGARPMDPEWVRSIRDQCVAAGVPFLFKGWGGTNKKKAGRVLDDRTWDEMPN